MSKGKIAKSIVEMAKELAEAKTPAVNRIDMNFKDVTKRVPELTEAARMVKSGQMSQRQYAEIVNRVKPVTPYDFVPKPATAEEAIAALTSNKKGQFGKAAEIKSGEKADLRLDIPSYSQHGVWVNSIHRKDAPTVYGSTSAIKNAEMIPSADKALKVATGETPKAPFAIIRGEWNPMDEEDAVKSAQKYLQHKDWRQVGYDPERHGYFYDRETMAPIIGADEVIQVGPLVLAKKPKYGIPEDFPFKSGGPVHKQDGGIMEAIEAAKMAGKPRSRPIAGPRQRVDIEQMRREVEENARRVAEVRKELAPTETKYSPSLKFLPKGTPESIRYAFEKAAKDAGPSMQVAQVDGKPVGVTSKPGGFGEALSSAGALLDIPSIAAGEEVFTRTGSPALAAAAYTLTDPIGAVLGAPAAGRAAIKGAKALAPKLGETAEQYMFRTGMALPLDVWHGSPHRFPPAAKNPLGEFDPTKIGTGEGAQAYGHGHYLAENTDVAKGYQSTLRERNAWEIDGQRVHGVRSRLDAQPINYAANALERFDGDKKAAIAWLKDSESPWDLEAAQLLAKSKTAQKAPGSLYKVDLPDEQIAKMLDWDKPLSEQPESVQKVLKDLAERDAKMYGEGGGLDYYMGDPESYSGESVYRYLTEQLSGQPETSSFFKEAGIPGIKYFDAASRDAGEGTRNFVVFPGGEEMLTIKERMKDGGLAEDEGRSSLDVSLPPELMKELIDSDRKAKAAEFARRNGMQEMPRRSGLRLTPDMIEFDKNIKGFAGRATYDIPVGKYGNISPYVGGFVVKPKGMDAMSRLTNAGITYTDRFKDGGKVKNPVSIDAMRLAVGGAATSNEAMLRRERRLGKVDKPVSISPKQLARGWAAGTLGLPGDIESLGRMVIPGASEDTFLPTSEDMLKKIPGAATDEVGQRAAQVGTLFGGAGAGRIANAIRHLPTDVMRAATAAYGPQATASHIFIGWKSPLWNVEAGKKAVELEKAGVAPVDIWKQTGTFRSPDGDLRQEISDVGSKFRGEKEMKELASSMKQQEADIKQKIKDSKEHPDLFPKQLKTAQGELRQQAKDIKARRTMESGPEARVGRGNRAEFALEHPELYKAYPLLSGMDVQQGGRSGSALGSYIRGIDESDPGMVNIYDRGLANDPRSTMIHEAQHAIQNIEGWGRGGNPEMAFQNPEAHKILEGLRKEASTPLSFDDWYENNFKNSAPYHLFGGEDINQAKKLYDDYVNAVPALAKKFDREYQEQAARLYYERLAGEAESRAAQARRDLTPEQRLEKFPLEVGDYGYDVKPEDIIVKRNKKGGQVSLDAMRLAVGGGLKSGIKAAKKIGDYVDPKSSKINKWKWRPLGDVQKDIGITEIPEYIQGGFGDLMADQLKRANAGDLSARDFLKAYGITQSSIGREGRSYNTATKAGLKLPKQDYIRPEGAFAEWLGSKAGQRFLDKAEQGVTDENALKQLREQFSPFGMSNALTDRLRWGINYAAENPDIANKFATSSVPDYRDLMLDIKGIGPAKSGFIGSMLGRGDLPTLDARQVLLHTGKYSSHPDFAKFTRPVVGGKPVAANESVDRLIARQEAMDADIDEALEPFYQHLMHHAVWDKAGGSKTTHEDLVRAMKDYKKGGEVSIDAMRLAVGGMAGGGRSSLIRGGIETVSKGLKSAEKAKQYATPAKFERAPAKTKAEVEALAQRMAPQFLGEFVRKPESTFSVAGKSMKQYRREKDLPIVYGGERPTPDVFDITKHEGEMMVGVPGDPTIAHRTLEQIGDIRPDAPVELHGGPLYGLEGEFWASGKGPATGLQAVARRGSEAYGGVPVVGQYIRMPEGTPYALHTTDALLSFQRPEMLGKRKLEQLNAEIRRGNLKNKFPEFVGFEDPDLVLLQAQDNPNLRKHINNVLLKPTTAEKYGLYPGPDIDAAITEAGLRNLETGATGFSVGRLFPESKLIESAHPTYEFDIPGRMIGQTKYPQPYELTFPDALKFAREGLKPGVGEFGMLKMIGPRQIIDAQLVDEINMYQEAMKKLTGKKKGGTVKKAVGGGVMSAGQKLAKAFVEAGKKAKLPEQAKEAASKGELFLPDEEVKRMQRELLQGVKKPEELAVGGQITSDDLILEERPL